MNKFFLSIFVIVLIIAGGLYYYYLKTGNSFGLGETIFSKGTVSISSADIVNGGKIPIINTCDWKNVSPQISFDRVTGDAKSLALIIEDTSTKPVPFTHYILFNIDPNVMGIDAGKIPDGAIVGTNDFGNTKYEGPCPPEGQTHSYYFRIYALDTTLNLTETAKRPDFDAAIKNHIIGKGYFYGTYSKVAN